MKDGSVEPSERAAMMDYFSTRLGPDVRVQLEQILDVPRTAGGKVRHVISSVPLVWGDARRSAGVVGHGLSDEHRSDPGTGA